MVTSGWLAPKPRPRVMAKNKKPRSSGSLMAALKRTIERAPTRPSDRASEDLTMVIIRVVVMETRVKFLANLVRFESD